MGGELSVMTWWGYVLLIVGTVFALAALCEFVAIGAVIVLGSQAVGWLQTGTWTAHTLGSLFAIASDVQLTHWVMIDRLIHYVLFDAEAALVVLAVAAAVVPVRGMMDDTPQHRPKPAKPPSGL
jgi:hypothetical protein